MILDEGNYAASLTGGRLDLDGLDIYEALGAVEALGDKVVIAEQWAVVWGSVVFSAVTPDDALGRPESQSVGPVILTCERDEIEVSISKLGDVRLLWRFHDPFQNMLTEAGAFQVICTYHEPWGREHRRRETNRA